MTHTSVYLFLCAATAAAFFGLSDAGNNITDTEALLDIKASITDDPMGIMRLWNDSTHFCQWYGVTCGSRHQRVTEINLNSSSLTGTIPPSVGNLSFMWALTLSSNSFKGTIPTEMGRLRRLQYLLLDTNNFHGLVPPSIFNNLSALVSINLGSNHFEGNLPAALGNMLPNLKFFIINNNNFSGAIPASISNISNLDTLVLAGNKFLGQVPSNCFKGLEKLEYVFLYDNFLGIGDPATDLDFVSSMANSTMLKRFVIGNNHFSGTFPTILCNFTMLNRLILGENNLTGEIPSCIGEKLINLQAFDARENNFVGDIPQNLGSLPILDTIYLSANQLSGNIPSSLGNLTRLIYLVLAGNHLQGSIPTTLSQSGDLIGLDLSYNNLSGSIPEEVLQLSSLSAYLNLSNNRFTGPLSAQVGSLVNVGVLDISENLLSGEIPGALGACSGLYGLYLEGNFFSGTIPATIVHKGLQFLDLSRNNLSGTIPKFQHDHQLQMLNLSYNNLQGQVPTSGVFSSAKGFFAYGNAGLCGGIPELKLHQCNISTDTHNKRLSHRNHHIRLALLFGICGFILLTVACVSLYTFIHRKRSQKTAGSSDPEAALPNLSYQMLHGATNGFSSENLLGSGASGVVYKGTLDQLVAKVVAIKIFNLEHHGASKSFVAECNTLRNIRHRNLIKVITVCSSLDYQGNDFKALVYEYMVNGSLEDWLHSKQKMSRVEEEAPRNLNLHRRLEIAVDVAFALEYLHHHCGNSSVIHCDLKPSNVLLDENMVARLGDFGLAKILSQGISNSSANQFSSTGVRGTIGYAPPEYGLGNEVSTSGDVYSYGILLLELFTGKRPTDDSFSRKGMGVHEFVRKAISEQDIKIVDHALLQDILGEDSNGHTIFAALISVFEVALTCSSQVPPERPDMRDVAAKLLSIRNKLQGLLEM